MPIQITSDNMSVTESMQTMTLSKIQKIEERLKSVPDDLVNIRVVLNTGPGEGEFTAKLEVPFSNKELFAKETAFNIESALIATVEDIERQLTKEKTKETGTWEDKRETKYFDPAAEEPTAV